MTLLDVHIPLICINCKNCIGVDVGSRTVVFTKDCYEKYLKLSGEQCNEWEDIEEDIAERKGCQ